MIYHNIATHKEKVAGQIINKIREDLKVSACKYNYVKGCWCLQVEFESTMFTGEEIKAIVSGVIETLNRETSYKDRKLEVAFTGGSILFPKPGFETVMILPVQITPSGM